MIEERLAEIHAAPRGAQTAAFFDFDGTVIDGYSAKAMLAMRARNREMGPAEIVRLAVAVADVESGRAEFDHLMVTGVRAFEGHTAEAMDSLGERLLRSVLGGSLFAEAWALVAAHRSRGHTVVIASSALPFQVEPMAREMGVEHILCTRLGVHDGVLTGTVEGPVLWGAGKADAVAAFAKRQGIHLKRSWAYGNGGEDLEFLELVGHPRPVNPTDTLREAAAERDWPVTDFARRGRAGLRTIVRTAAAYGSMAAAFAGGVGISLLNRDRQAGVNLSMSVGPELSLGLAGVSLRVTGGEHLWSSRPAVFIFNHQSWLDGMIIMKLLREDVTGVAKAEVARQPGFGQFAWFANMAFVDRSDGASARDALRPVVERLEEGYSIVLAPEGTRSTTPRVLPFKKGAFHMAMQGGVPIVPIVIRNAGQLMWRGSTLMRPGTVDVHVLPPIEVSGWDRANLGVHVDQVRQSFIDTLSAWPHGGSGRTAVPTLRA